MVSGFMPISRKPTAKPQGALMASIELRNRPEPHFPEGRGWPRPGWQGRILWLLLVAVVLVAITAAFSTEMVVNISVSGSLARGADGKMQAILLADDPSAEQIEIGQPVRLHVESGDGWGIVVGLDHTYDAVDRHYRRVVVTVIGPRSLLGTVADQACQGRVLVGFTATIHGLLQLATDQATTAARTGPAELRLRIPATLRDTDQYRRLDQELRTGYSSQ